MTDDESTTDDIEFGLEDPGKLFELLRWIIHEMRNDGTIENEEAREALDGLKEIFRPAGGWEKYLDDE